MPPGLRVLLVEDDWSVRNAVRDYLVKRDMVVFESNCLDAALATAKIARPDVAIIDIVLPKHGDERANFDQHVGIEVARQLREQFSHMGIVFLSAYVDRGPQVVQLFISGHHRIVYLLKGSKPQALLDAIYKVAGGTSALEIAAGVKTARHSLSEQALEILTAEERVCVKEAVSRIVSLSEPEMLVFEAIGACRTRRQAAQELDISTKTIGSHMEAIYRKLNIRKAHAGLNQLALLAKIHLVYHLQENTEKAQSKNDL